jgi:membrane protease YdiL (CAAX protease family)
VAGTPAAAWVCGAFALYLGVFVAGGLIAAGLGPRGAAAGSLSALAAGAASVYGVGIAASVAVVVVLGRRWPGRFAGRWGDIGVGLGALAAAAPALVLVSDAAVLVRTLLVGSPPGPIAHATLEAIVSAPGDWRAIVLIAGAVVGAPVFEEAVYRGLLQTGLVRALGRRWAAVMLTAVIFALMHRLGGAVPWHALPTIFVLGLVCGLVAEKRGVWAAMATHAAFNASQVALAVAVMG